MNTDSRKRRISYSFVHILYLLFFTGLVFSFRAVSSISIAAILMAGIILNRSSLAFPFRTKARNLFLTGCVLLFLLQVVALLYTANESQGWAGIRVKTGLLITPLAICLTTSIVAVIYRKLILHYCIMLFTATVYCLFISFLNYQRAADESLFFYHSLVNPLNQHAVYFSLLVMIGLIFLLENSRERGFILARLFQFFLIAYFSVFLFLLSSKLVIGFYIFYLLYYFIKLLQKNKLNRLTITGLFVLCVTLVSLVLTVRNPVSKRFSEIINGDIKLVAQDSFDKGDYFNGLQFRLLQWRFVGDILTENKCWWTGVSPGDAQDFLNKKYLSKNMYSGEPGRGDRGYLIYNTHNQFLETILQNGIIGLSVLLIICFSLVKMAVNEKNRVTSFIILLLLAWLFTESVFETQYGIVSFTFFPLFVTTGKTEKPAF